VRRSVNARPIAAHGGNLYEESMAKNGLTHDEALAKGICTDCREKPLAPGRKLFCADCLAKRNESRRARDAKGRAS
jgi:hypothetical protein